ncbi:Coenzyme F420 hydrogenase/dehydrogenase, beta subunit C-terminal domain [Nitrosomonas sp.]|uniref:Coenzyme F420 hydrogenase/dehydrogenase, beta subunit C-terminal domain n=1 Tax=Nitrosomonas sp. TaxID=42353 RepID=UPI00273218C9|nr:Coenzyme F420 hydrogenase/dehydrogenase, beta subunit C-terminal domain [Nitrosomonas sp.]
MDAVCGSEYLKFRAYMFPSKLDIEQVVNHGYCIGCGVCKVADPAIEISLNRYGEYVANLSNSSKNGRRVASQVCPFATNANETELAEEVFDEQMQHEVIGRFSGLFAGYSLNDRESGSSGGVMTYIIKQLLESKKIDYAILARPRIASNARGMEFAFDVVSSELEVTSGATSFYYPVTYSEVLVFIAENPGRYAITGVPCFHKALRLLKRQNPLYRERIQYQLGLVCGQMKSALYFEYLLRRADVPAGKVESACFRRKDLESRADEYFFEATTRGEDKKQVVYRAGNKQIGINWGIGLFKPKACDYCDDVFAETADIAVMDGWLPQYVRDGKGTSLIVVRDRRFLDILSSGRETGGLYLESINTEDIVKSQQGGINHRRKGLAYRLSISKNWMPTKRIRPSSDFPLLFKLEQIIRLAFRKSSRHAMAMQIKIGSRLLIFDILTAWLFIPYHVIQRLKRIIL